MNLTLDEITKEINANNFAIARTIREQMDTRDERATRIVNAYEGAVKGSPEAEAVVVELYNAWRADHAPVVAPIAEHLGHPLPGGVAGNGLPVAQEAPAGPAAFWQPPVEAPSAAVEPSEPPEPTPTPQSPPQAAPEPQNGSKRARTGWAQTAIVTLTRALLTAQDKDAALAAVAAELGRPLADVRAKAAELQLIDAPRGKAYELTDTDKNVLRKKLLDIVPENAALDIKVTMFKYVAAQVREIVKELAE